VLRVQAEAVVVAEEEAAEVEVGLSVVVSP
jgi:hypothetical protein